MYLKEKTKTNEIKSNLHKWLNYKNRNQVTIINRLKVEHTKLTHGYLMVKEPLKYQTCITQLTTKHLQTQQFLNESCRLITNGHNKNIFF